MTIITNAKHLILCACFCFSQTTLAMFNGDDTHDAPDEIGFDGAAAAEAPDFGELHQPDPLAEFKNSLLYAISNNDVYLVEHLLQQLDNLAELLGDDEEDGRQFIGQLFLNCKDLAICKLLMKYKANEFLSHYFLRRFIQLTQEEINTQIKEDGTEGSDHHSEQVSALTAIVALLIGSARYS